MKYKRLLGYGAIGLTLIAVGVAFIKPISASNVLFRAHASNVTSGSIIFNGANATRSGSTNITHCDSRIGGDVICKTTLNNPSESTGYVGAVLNDSEIKFFETDGVTEYTFENLKTITFVHEGTSFSFKLIGIYDDGTSFNLEKSASTKTPRTLDFSTLGRVSHLRVKVTSSSVTKLSSISLTYDCSSKVLTGIETTNPTKTAYSAGEKFDPTGMIVKAVYSNEQKIATEAYSFLPSGQLTTSDTFVTIFYKGFSTTIDISVSAAESLSGIYSYSSYVTIDFDNLTYTYNPESTVIHFSIAQSGTSLTFNYVSGTNTNCGNYRLFDGGNTPVSNLTGVISSPTEFKIKLYGPFGSYDRTFTKS